MSKQFEPAKELPLAKFIVKIFSMKPVNFQGMNNDIYKSCSTESTNNYFPNMLNAENFLYKPVNLQPTNSNTCKISRGETRIIKNIYSVRKTKRDYKLEPEVTIKLREEKDYDFIGNWTLKFGCKIYFKKEQWTFTFAPKSELHKISSLPFTELKVIANEEIKTFNKNAFKIILDHWIREFGKKFYDIKKSFSTDLIAVVTDYSSNFEHSHYQLTCSETGEITTNLQEEETKLIGHVE